MRDAVVHQMNRHHVDTPTSPRHSHHGNQRLLNDESVLLAATQLLELSRRNGITKLRDLCKPDNRKRKYLNVSSSKDEMVMKGAVNGFGDEDRDSVHEGEEGEGWAEGGRVEEHREGEGEKMEVESGENGEGGNGERGEVQMKEEIKESEDIPLCGKILCSDCGYVRNPRYPCSSRHLATGSSTGPAVSLSETPPAVWTLPRRRENAGGSPTRIQSLCWQGDQWNTLGFVPPVSQADTHSR